MAWEFIEEKPDFSNEPLYQTAARAIPRTLARGVEAIAGLPGDVGNSILGLANFGISKVTGKKSPLPSKIPIFPTSEDINESITKPLGGEYLQPQSENEQFWDQITKDAATLWLPSAGKANIAKNVLKSATRSAVGNIAGWGAEEVTGSPLVGAGVKIGTMALSAIPGSRSQIKNIEKSSYNQAYKAIPDGKKVSISKAKDQIDKITRSVSRGDNPYKEEILKRFSAFDPLIEKPIPEKTTLSTILNESGTPFSKSFSGKIGNNADIKDIISLKQDWNKHLRDPKIAEESSKYIKKGVGILNKVIEDYGKNNDAFYKPWKTAEELNNALNSTNLVQKALSKSPLLQKTVSNPVVKYALLGGIGHGISSIAPAKIAAGASAAIGANEAAKWGQLLWKSPIARNYYKNVISSTLKNDIPTAAKYAGKLSNVADKLLLGEEEPQSNWEFID